MAAPPRTFTSLAAARRTPRSAAGAGHSAADSRADALPMAAQQETPAQTAAATPAWEMARLAPKHFVSIARASKNTAAIANSASLPIVQVCQSDPQIEAKPGCDEAGAKSLGDEPTAALENKALPTAAPVERHPKLNANARAFVPRPAPAPKTAAAGAARQAAYLQRRYECVRAFALDWDADGRAFAARLRLPLTDPDFPYDIDALSLLVRVSEPAGSRLAVTVEIDAERPPSLPAAVRERIVRRMRDAAEGVSPDETLPVRALLRVLERSAERWLSAPLVLAPAASSVRVAPAGVVSSPGPRLHAPNAAGDSASGNRTQCGADATDAEGSIELPFRYGNTAQCETKEEGASSAADGSAARQEAELRLRAAGLPLRSDARGGLAFFEPQLLHPEDLWTAGSPASSDSLVVELLNYSLRADGGALAVAVQLSLLIVCPRCHRRTALPDLRADVDRTVPCAHCGTHMALRWRPAALVPGGPGVLGVLRAARCVPAELLPDSRLHVACASCDAPGTAASVVVAGALRPGRPADVQCRACGARVALSFSGVAWRPARGAPEAGRAKAAVPLPTRVGEALPGNGTCAHFRRSTRWFRFPCCGRAYACERCHDEDPSNAPKHPAEWATRHICGFCSREAPSSQRVCACGAVPAEGRGPKDGAGPASVGAFWEGGRGVRDQALLSRKDTHKYRNQAKTVSRKKAAG